MTLGAPDNTQSLLALRKVTRAVSEVVRVQLQDYLATLSPLMRPDAVLGEHVLGGRREASRRPDQALKELQALYETISPTQPLNLRRELAPPFDLPNADVQLTPVEYV